MSDHESTKPQFIAQIRGHFEALGHDTENLTDEDIERGVMRMWQAMSNACLSMAEAVNGLARLRAAGLSVEELVRNVAHIGDVRRG
jgi:hypothetical protein